MAVRKRTTRRAPTRKSRKSNTRRKKSSSHNGLFIFAILLIAIGWGLSIYLYLQNQELQQPEIAQAADSSTPPEVLEMKARELKSKHPDAEIFEIYENTEKKN
ncbi:MAG: hypothetical protein AAGA18_06340 [Verrucomicrobiota bacterium]